MAVNDIIWTNHARERLNDRKIGKDLIFDAITNSDRVVTKEDGAKEYQRTIDGKTVAAIIKENEKGEKVIVSCWINPPNPGTKDFKIKQRRKEMYKAGVLKKLWLTFLDQIGL